MAKKKDETEEKKILTPEEQLGAYLKETKTSHYNFEEDHKYKSPCSSLLLNAALVGGLYSGAHRFIGLAGGGKSSCALDFMFHFLQEPTKKRRGLYVDAEGKLTDEIKERSGIVFVKDFAEWKDGTCFHFQCNIYETVFGLKRKLINDNPSGVEYFFITDSTDSLIKQEDFEKPEDKSITVGGGSLITSVFLKKVGLAMAKRGHIDIFISQIRDQIKINPYEVTTPKQGKASGPRALEHQAGVVIDFLPRFNGDLIRDADAKDSKILGHFCKCRIIKSNDEKAHVEVKYAIKYGQKNGNSVWVSYDLADMLCAWEILKKKEKGTSLIFDEEFRKEMMGAFPNKEIPETFRTSEWVQEWIDEDKEIQKYLVNKFKNLLG